MFGIKILTLFCLVAGLADSVIGIPQGGGKTAVKKRPDIEIVKGKQPSEVHCPAADNGARKYTAKSYSAGQVKAALIDAVNLTIDGKQKGANKYPNVFGNKEGLPFDCGSSKREFPMLLNGHVYNGEDVQHEPDRLVFEYVEKGGKVVVAVCGVMRHGKNGFLKC